VRTELLVLTKKVVSRIYNIEEFTKSRRSWNENAQGLFKLKSKLITKYTLSGAGILLA